VAARTLAQAAESIGAPLTIADLRESIPQWRETVQVSWGDHILHFAPPPAAGGLAAAELFQILTEASNFSGASAPERAHLFVEAAKRAFVDRERWMAPDGGVNEQPATVASDDRAEALMANYDSDRAIPIETLEPGFAGRAENPWAASFVVADQDGNAVACNVTMNELFGTMKVAPGTGIFLAPAPNSRGAGAISLGPVIMSNKPNGGFYFAGAASGGATGISALVRVMVGVLDADEPLEAAIAAPRFHHNGFPDIAFHEPGEDAATLAALAERGHQVEEIGIIGRIEAVWCPDSLQGDESTCKVATDPRVDGLAVVLSE
jgi:gamma-glutamyltranspeptidase/glutathione hydrolase